MKIEFTCVGLDPALEATIRAAIAPLEAAGVRDVTIVQYTNPGAEAWAAWVTTRDGWSDGVVTGRPFATLADQFPEFFDKLRRMVAALGAA